MKFLRSQDRATRQARATCGAHPLSDRTVYRGRRIIAINERHLKRMLWEYVSYHHEDRTHLGPGKGTPGRRTRCVDSGRVLSQDRLGGFAPPL